MKKQYSLRNYDFRLVFYVIVLSLIGIAVIGSADSSFQNKQVLGLILGLVCMVVVSLIDYEYLIKFAWIFYAIGIILLVLVQLIGEEVNYATRWLSIAGITFQPSEICKVFIILFFAYLFMKYHESINTVQMIAVSVVFLAIPLALILKEPDLSTSIIVVLIFATMIFMAGLNYKIVGSVVAIVVALTSIGLWLILKSDASFLQGYQTNRILAWRYPEEYPDLSYQQMNSIMAIGSGQLFGKGLNNNLVDSVKNGNFISEPQTDFIFAVVGEELGFIGSIIIIALLFLVVLECIIIAARAKDMAGRIICSGMAAWIGFQTFVNIGVVSGLLPNTGVTLPFISYGLTSLVSVFLAIGIVLNVGLQPNASRKTSNEKSDLDL